MIKNHSPFRILIFVICVLMIIPPIGADETTSAYSDKETVVRGTEFTISLTGLPNSQYYVWVTRTSSMTGAPQDQPPIINSNLMNIAQDSPGGPFTIGSYAFQNGNGRTILQDVAPSTPQLSKTRYYALITTDNAGRAIIGFQTSQSTAIRTFSVRVENAKSYDEDSVKVVRGSVSIRAEEPRATEYLPVQTLSTQETSPLSGTIPTTMQGSTNIPTRTVPSEIGFGLLSLVICFFIARKTN